MLEQACLVRITLIKIPLSWAWMTEAQELRLCSIIRSSKGRFARNLKRTCSMFLMDSEAFTIGCVVISGGCLIVEDRPSASLQCKSKTLLNRRTLATIKKHQAARPFRHKKLKMG